MPTLEQITSTQAGKEIDANNNFSAVAPAGAFGRRVAAITGLTWAYFGGEFWANGARRVLANGTISCSASQTNYIGLDVEGDGTTPAVTVNTSGFVAGEIPLCVVVCDGSAITSETDYRVALNLDPQPPDRQVIAYAASITPNVSAGRRVMVATLTGAITVNNPINPFAGAELVLCFTQDATGSRVITWGSEFNLPTDVGGAANETGAVHVIRQGSVWVQVGGALEWH